MKRPSKTRVVPIDPDVVAMAEHVGARIRTLRVMAGMTVTDLAAAVNVHRVHASNMQSGLPSMKLEWMVLIAKALGVPVAALFEGAPGVGKRTAGDGDPHLQLILSQFAGLKKEDQALVEKLVGRLLRRPRIVVAGKAETPGSAQADED